MAQNTDLEYLSLMARRAVRTGDWATVNRCARQILKRDQKSAEGHFLAGQAAKAAGANDASEKSFNRALRLDRRRYDAAIELAGLHVSSGRYREALPLLRGYRDPLANSPVYLEMAASLLSRMDLQAEALPLYQRACELQPGIERLRAGLAACSVFLGEVAEARAIYEQLLQHNPGHRRFHYELAKLRTATDSQHVDQMRALLAVSGTPRDKIFLYYAIGKELEDLGSWDEAFHYYERGGDAVKAVSPYDVTADLELIDTIIETCDNAWLRASVKDAYRPGGRTPVFVVGLPRSGTTLTERILSSHTTVGSVGETFFLPQALCKSSGFPGASALNANLFRGAAAVPPNVLASHYFDMVDYKLGPEPLFIEKLPENYLLIGHISRSFPRGVMVHVRRNPMDACFAMYKQSYFRYAYSLDDLGRYYLAYDRLMRHWRSLLGDRLIELQYEDLVTNPNKEVRQLLQRLDLSFEPACLEFESSRAPTRTASAVQVREKIHTRSVGRWRRFQRQLRPLQDYLARHGIAAG